MIHMESPFRKDVEIMRRREDKLRDVRHLTSLGLASDIEKPSPLPIVSKSTVSRSHKMLQLPQSLKPPRLSRLPDGRHAFCRIPCHIAVYSG